MMQFKYFERKKVWHFKSKSRDKFLNSNKTEIKLFEFGAFRIKIKMLPHDKILLHML